MEKEYTRNQLEVINITHGYNMVLAGPGCGKTDILAERLARAYEQHGIALSDMLCLTFTNRAARGMFERIKKQLGGDSSDLFVGNIHRYCSHFLFEESASGVNSESSIMDEDDANEVLSSEISDAEIMDLIDYRIVENYYGDLVSVDWEVVNNFLGVGITSSGITGNVKEAKAQKIIDAVRNKIPVIQHLMYQVRKGHPRNDFYNKEYLHNNLIPYGFGVYSDFEDACLNAELYKRESCRNACDKIIYLAYKYQVYKESNGLLDFEDLLLYTYDAYYNDKEKEYKRFKWIQIDEIQDLSQFQLSLVDLLTNNDDDFSVLYLGDEQQAIYSFMGASLDSLNYLKERCEKIYRLDKNFRSPKYLLDIYNEYAIKELHVDEVFLPRPKDSLEAGFYDVCVHHYNDEDDETERIYQAILPYLRAEERSEEKTALLVPWNSDANKISDRLKKDRIAHFKISGQDSFQTVHMKTLMAHFNAVSNDFNLIAWSRLLKQTYAVDTYKQGRRIVEKLRKAAMCPSDLLRKEGSYLAEFIDLFDNEEIVVFDTETTGVDVFNDDIVQIAAYKIRNGEILSDSFFNIIMKTEREIPGKLGKEENPLIKIYNETENKYERYEGLNLFMEYVGNRILLGHNVNYDYNILKNNLKRHCPKYADYKATIIDTLKLAHLISPKQRKYKLGYLVEKLGLTESNEDKFNYHQADEDIKATLALAKFCRKEASNYIVLQKEVLDDSTIQNIIKEWKEMGYRECYLHTYIDLYVLYDDSHKYAITKEMEYASEELQTICEFRPVDSFKSIIDFLNADVINRPDPEANALITHFSNHLMDLSTYREADLCSSSSFKEKLFVSTVHKAKGLEFENVIVMRAVPGRYPHFSYVTEEQIDEGKRLFYVGISRAMKRLIVSYNGSITPFMKNIIHNFTLRKNIREGNNSTVLVEIGNREMRVSININGNLYQKRYNIVQLYYTFENQYEVIEKISQNYNNAEKFDTIDRFVTQYGGFIINN